MTHERVIRVAPSLSVLQDDDVFLNEQSAFCKFQLQLHRAFCDTLHLFWLLRLESGIDRSKCHIHEIHSELGSTLIKSTVGKNVFELKNYFRFSFVKYLKFRQKNF